MSQNRVVWIAGAALACLVALSACQTGGFRSNGAGASGSGFSYLADIRSSASLSALAPDAKLETAAIRQAEYMAAADRMTHDTGRGRDFASRMKAGSVAAPAAENLAHGRMETAKVFQMWMDSTGHRTNMLDPRFNRYGLAHATAADGRRYWALVLGK